MGIPLRALTTLPLTLTLKPQRSCTNNAKIHHFQLTKTPFANKNALISCKHKNQSNRWSLDGMTALVTGGTRGIGYTLASIVSFLFYAQTHCKIDGFY